MLLNVHPLFTSDQAHGVIGFRYRQRGGDLWEIKMLYTETTYAKTFEAFRDASMGDLLAAEAYLVEHHNEALDNITKMRAVRDVIRGR